ncbi:MAG: hypothetical protein KC501_24800 [Myxococcales bacterium]|nr:hypothetical protein [Myxococcales bacterium]
MAGSSGGEPAAGPGPGDAEPGREDIGELWQQAQARIDTAKYDEAIEGLDRLYELIALDPDAAALRLRVQWALHRAHLGAHGVDGELEHLLVARDLLEKYREALPPGEVDQRDEASAALERVQGLIDEQEAREAAEREQAERERREQEQREREQQERAREQQEPGPDELREPPPPRDTSRRGMVIAGAVGSGLGLVGMGVMAGGLGFASRAIDTFKTQPDERVAARDDIRKGNAIAIAGAAAGGVLLVGGAVLLGLGLRRRAATTGSLAAGPGQLGLSWRLRF